MNGYSLLGVSEPPEIAEEPKRASPLILSIGGTRGATFSRAGGLETGSVSADMYASLVRQDSNASSQRTIQTTIDTPLDTPRSTSFDADASRQTSPGGGRRGRKSIYGRNAEEAETKLEGPSPEKSYYAELFKTVMIDPTKSVGLVYWDILILTCLVSCAVVGPYEAAFIEPKLDGLFVYNRVLDFLFFCDMILQFFTAREDPTSEGMLVQDPVLIARDYVSFWFWVDLLSVMPVDAYCVAEGVRESRELAFQTKFARLLRVMRLLRLSKLKRITQRWQTSIGIRYAMISLFSFMFLILLTTHWMSCLWGGVGWQYASEHSWLTALKESKGGDDDLYDDASDVYVLAFYWAIMTITSIGYGDITPQNRLEYTICTCCMLCMAFTWAYVIGGICGVVATMQPHEIAFKQNMDDLNEMMDEHDMPHEMRKELRAYFHQSRFLNRQRIERGVTDQLSPSLQGEVALFLHEYFVQKIPYLVGSDREVYIEVSRSLRMMVFPPYEHITRPRTLYILRQGICMHQGKVLAHGCVWGTDHLLHNQILREPDCARALSYANVLMLHASDVYHLLQRYPAVEKQVRSKKNHIALMRGVKKIAAAAQDVGIEEWQEGRDKITEAQSSLVLQDVINNRFDPSTYQSYCVGQKKGGILTDTVRTKDQGLVLEAIAHSVHQLTKQVEDIHHSQAELSSMVQGLRGI